MQQIATEALHLLTKVIGDDQVFDDSVTKLQQILNKYQESSNMNLMDLSKSLEEKYSKLQECKK